MRDRLALELTEVAWIMCSIVYTLNEIVQGRLRDDKKTYAFFLDIQKAYISVLHDGLWYKLWDMGIKGRMWCVIKKMYESSKSGVLLEGRNQICLQLGKVSPRVVVYPPYYFQYSLMIC